MRPERFSRFSQGLLVASTLAGCNAVANLSEFDNAHVGSSDAAASRDVGAGSKLDAEAVEAAQSDDAQEEAKEDSTLDAGPDATLKGDASSDAGGSDATVAEAGAPDGATQIDAGIDAETEAGCTCSAYGATLTSCYSPCAPTCAAYFGDCNASSSPNPDDGCETYLDSLTSCRASCGGTAAACDPTQVCNAGVCGEAHGLAVFTVPLSTVSTYQRYADKPLNPWNLAGKTIIVRMYAPGATGGQVYVYLSDEASDVGPGTTLPLSQLADGWTDIVLADIVDAAPFSAEQVKQVTIEVGTGATVASWTNPTVVYLDSVRSSDVTIDDTFDTSIGNIVTSTQMIATIAGSTVTWQNSVTAPVDGGSGGAADAGSADAADSQ